MGPLIVLVTMSLALVCVDLVRRPGLRRLAMRNVARRPAEALLVVLGSMLGTAFIAASFIVGDSFGASIRNIAPNQLGEIDIEVWPSNPAQLLPVVAQVNPTTLPGVDGVITVTQANATAATIGAKDTAQAEPHASIVEVDFDAARRFGSDPAATGVADLGATPTGDQAVIGRDLARSLHLAKGDRLAVYAYGASRSVVIRDIAARKGFAGFTAGNSYGSQAPTVLLAPGTLAAMFGEGRVTGAVPPNSGLLISAAGGVFDGRLSGKPVLAEVNRRLGKIGGVQVVEAKADILDQAEKQASGLRQLYGAFGGFSVIAGILLLVNIFVMLAEERKTELGVLRAVGLKRNQLVRAFGMEGALYAVMASVVGSIVGIGVGWVIAAIGARLSGQGGIDLAFAVEGGHLVTSMLIGILISMATIWGTSLRIARLNIIRAIREQPDPPHDRRDRRSLVLGSMGVAVGLLMLRTGVSGNAAMPVVVGPAIALFSSITLLGRRIPRRLAVSVPCALLILWCVTCFSVFPKAFQSPDISMFVVQGVVMSAAAVAIATNNADLLASAAERLSGASLAARLGVAYPLARRFRTGLLLAMYTLVVFTLTFMSVFSQVIVSQGPRLAAQVKGGYDLIVDSSATNPIPTAQLAADPDVKTVAPLRRGFPKFKTDWIADPRFWVSTGFDQKFIDGGVPALDSTFLSGKPHDDLAAWKMVLDGGPVYLGKTQQSPQAIPVIVPSFFLQDGNGPPKGSPKAGMVFTMFDPASGKSVKLVAAGVLAGDWAFNGVFMPSTQLTSFLDVNTTSVNRHFVSVRDGADPDVVAKRLNASHIANGTDATSFIHLIDRGLGQQRGFLTLTQGYLGLGLLVGIAGLGVVMLRAVRERRREIGMLRAMGLQARIVRRAFMLEASFIAMQGIVLGIGLGLLTSWSVLTRATVLGGSKLAFQLPVFGIVLLLIVPLAASLLAVLSPARAASRIRPAVALRIAD